MRSLLEAGVIEKLVLDNDVLRIEPCNSSRMRPSIHVTVTFTLRTYTTRLYERSKSSWKGFDKSVSSFALVWGDADEDKAAGYKETEGSR